VQKSQEESENNHDLVSCAGKAEQVHEGRGWLRVFGRGRCGAGAVGGSLHAALCDYLNNVGTLGGNGGCYCFLRDDGGCSRAGGGFVYCNKIGRGGDIDMLVEVQRIVSRKRKRRSGRRRRPQRRYLDHLNGRHRRILRGLFHGVKPFSKLRLAWRRSAPTCAARHAIFGCYHADEGPALPCASPLPRRRRPRCLITSRRGGTRCRRRTLWSILGHKLRSRATHRDAVITVLRYCTREAVNLVVTCVCLWLKPENADEKRLLRNESILFLTSRLSSVFLLFCRLPWTDTTVLLPSF
jgi:hypothetical protein